MKSEDVTEEAPPRRRAAACPWCSDGTLLQLKGDGLGGMSLWCTQCGCKGPTVPIADDFDLADEAAISRWSVRRDSNAGAPPKLPAGVFERVSRSVELQKLLSGGALPDQAGISIRAGDLRHIMQAVGARL